MAARDRREAPKTLDRGNQAILRHPRNPQLILVQPADFLGESCPEEIRGDLEPLRAIADWAQQYLCQAHPELGREGPVCPYVQTSLRKCTFHLTVRRGRHYSPEQVESIIVELRNFFLELEPTSGPALIFKTILCLFPDFLPEDLPLLIDDVQSRLKSEYVPHGLMVGEFHDGPPNKGGLWNPDFRPLRAPVPMLVIRNMVATDFAFLKDDPEMFGYYLRTFGNEVPAHLRADVAATAVRWNLFFPNLDELPHVHPRVRSELEKHHVRARVHRHQDQPKKIEKPLDLANCLGIEVARITKSLFLRSRQFRYLVVVVPAEAKIDLNALAAQLDYGRLSLADLEELAALLDYSPGGVSPIGVDADIPVVVDVSLLAWPSILIAAGEVAVELEIKPQDLVRLAGAKVLALTGAGQESADP